VRTGEPDPRLVGDKSIVNIGRTRGGGLKCLLLALADAAERQAVRDALATLPAEPRNALFSAFFQGLSHQEIATCLRTLLDTNEGTYTSDSADAAAAITRRARQLSLGTSKTFRHTLDIVTGHGNQDDMVVHVGYNNGCSPLL
jgi:Sigma-70, region 4